MVVMREKELGKKSKWWPYFQILPKQYTTAPWFSDQQLGLLGGTFASTVAQEELSSYAKLIQTVRNIKPEYSADEVKWALATVSSRAFRVGKSKLKNMDGIPFLAPGADLINHNPKAQVGWKLAKENETPYAIANAGVKYKSTFIFIDSLLI
jgi:hypothetical protein